MTTHLSLEAASSDLSLQVETQQDYKEDQEEESGLRGRAGFLPGAELGILIDYTVDLSEGGQLVTLLVLLDAEK
jgi:hypothetical protein